MSHSRRNFIKYVVAGSVAAGCPIDASLLAVPDEKCSTTSRVEGEHFEVCHQVRDGHQFQRPEATRKADVVIVGGGVAGLSAGYFLRGKDWLLLEKEDHFGGNAYQEEYDGAAFATGSAYAFKGDHGDQLAAEMGLKLLPVNNPDPTIVNKTFVADTWNAGLDHLPYSQEVRASFKKFRDDMMKIDVLKRMDELDAQPLTDFTGGYAPEIQQWWDGYGPSNWGATSEDTSAFVALASLQGLVTGEDSKRVILPGGLVVPGEDNARVTYFHGGQLTTVSAKAVIMCTQKHITSRLVMGIPYDQKTAMRRTRYAPYPVVNAIFDKPVYNRGYDTWCPGNSFTDFIVADWTIRNSPGYHQKHNILSFYTPLRETQRSTLLEEDNCKSLAARVLADFQKLLPEFNVDPVEVRIYRRGHPMFMATPGQYTKNRIAAAHAMERIYFSNNDSGGPESLTSEAIRFSQGGAEWAEMILAGKPGAKDFAEKVLNTREF
jgi:hypothetical protein